MQDEWTEKINSRIEAMWENQRKAEREEAEKRHKAFSMYMLATICIMAVITLIARCFYP